MGVGAAVVGGSVLARKAMERRTRWRDDDGMASDMGMSGTGLEPGDDATSLSAPPL